MQPDRWISNKWLERRDIGICGPRFYIRLRDLRRYRLLFSEREGRRIAPGVWRSRRGALLLRIGHWQLSLKGRP